MTHRRPKISTTGRACLALLASAAAIGAPGQAPAQGQIDVNVEAVPVADGIHMLVGRGGNIGACAGDDGVLLIDDQYSELVPKLREAVAELGGREVRMVLNTHWHRDHTGGNEPLTRTGALIVAHDNVRTRMSARHFSTFFNSTTEPSPREALPVVTFGGAVTFHLNGHTIRAEHVPTAHTDGDTIVYFEEANVVHMGDNFFNGMYPFIDGDSGGSVKGMVAAVNHVLARIDDETKVIPGHGALSDRQGLAEFGAMLQTVEQRIRESIDAGRGLEEVVASKPTAEFDARWGQGFIKPDDWVALVYALMTRESPQ